MQVYQFEFDAFGPGVVIDLLSDLEAVPARAGAANDDANSEV